MPANTTLLPGSRASVAMGFVAGMLSGLRARGRDAAPLLARAGIAGVRLDDPRARVPLTSYADLYNLLVAELADEGFGLFAAPLRPGCFEFLCRAVLSSRSLEEALRRAGRFLHLVLPELALDLQRERGLAQLSIVECAPIGGGGNDPRRVFALEWMLRLLHGLACWLAARSLPLSSVQFPFARPAHADDYTLIYTAHSSFDAPQLCASLNAHLLDLPVRRSDEELEAFLEGTPGKIAMLYRRDRECVRQVRDLLAQALPVSLSIEQVASQLHQSPRTLHRRLQEEGSSFRGIKDALRRDLAMVWLERRQFPVGEIASRLGYAELSAFFRAFRKWTGEAPTTYRRRLAGPGGAE